MIKFLIKPVVCLCLSMMLITSPPARADEEAVRMIGGVALGLLGLALDKNAEKAQTEEPTQNASSQKKSKTSSLQMSDEVWEHQMMLEKMGFYNGALDGLKGSGTTTAIKKWERSQGLVADGIISADEYQLLHYDLNDEQDQIKYWKEDRQFLKEKSDTNSDIAQKKKTLTDDDITYGAKRFSGVAKDQYLLGVCKKFKQNYLTTDITKKGLERANIYITKAKEKVSKEYACNGYAQAETDKMFEMSDSLVADGEYAEKLDTLLQILDADSDDYGATNKINTACSYLTNVTAVQQVELYKFRKFDMKTCEYK